MRPCILLGALLGFLAIPVAAWEKPQLIYEDPSFGPIAVCTVSSLLVRKGPSQSHEALGRIKRGEVVKVLGISPGDGEEINGIAAHWVLVRSSGGVQGHAFAGFLEDIYSSARTGNSWALKTLLEAGVDVNSERRSQFPSCGRPELHFTPLYAAVEAAQLESVKTLLSFGAKLDKGMWYEIGRYDPVPIVHISPLMAAIISTQTASLLLVAGADPNFLSENGESALSRSLNQDRLAMADMLVESGARPNDIFRELWPTQILGKKDRLEWFLSHGGDVDVQDSFGWTPLLHAELNSAGENARYLISKGAVQTDIWKPQLMILASTATADDFRKGLASVPSIDFNSAYGTPLGWVISQVEISRLEKMQALLERGASPNSRLPNRNPLICASGNVAEMNLLIKFGADTAVDCFELDEEAGYEKKKFDAKRRFNSEDRDMEGVDLDWEDLDLSNVRRSRSSITEASALAELGGLLGKIKTARYTIETKITNRHATISETRIMRFWKGPGGQERWEQGISTSAFSFALKNKEEAWHHPSWSNRLEYWKGTPMDRFPSVFPILDNGMVTIFTPDEHESIKKTFHWSGVETVSGEESFYFSSDKGHIWLSRKTGLPVRLATRARITVVKTDRNSTTMTSEDAVLDCYFKNAEMNISLGDNLFRYRPPPGTYVWGHHPDGTKSPLWIRPYLRADQRKALDQALAEIDGQYQEMSSFSAKLKIEHSDGKKLDGFLIYAKPYRLRLLEKMPGGETTPFYLTDGYEEWWRATSFISFGTAQWSNQPMYKKEIRWRQVGGSEFHEQQAPEPSGVKGFLNSLKFERRHPGSQRLLPFPESLLRPFAGVNREYVVFDAVENNLGEPSRRFTVFSHDDMPQCRVWVNSAGLVRQLEIWDAVGKTVATRFDLENIRLNPLVAGDLFRP